MKLTKRAEKILVPMPFCIIDRILLGYTSGKVAMTFDAIAILGKGMYVCVGLVVIINAV